ncbi:hypothetical protein D3C71_1436910 [compost metagenome]
MVDGDHGLAGVPGGIAALHFQLGQGEQRAAGRTALQGAAGIASGLDVLRHAKLGRVAEAHHQHARGGDAVQIVQQGGVAGLAADIATLDQRRDAATGGGVQRLRCGGQRLVGEGADDDAIHLSRGWGGVVQGEFQRH